MNKIQYEKWLSKRGLTRNEVKRKKKKFGNPNSIPDYQTFSSNELSNSIPANGTKSPDISKSEFSKQNYAMVPSYNKGPIQPVSKNDLKSGAGRKL